MCVGAGARCGGGLDHRNQGASGVEHLTAAAAGLQASGGRAAVCPEAGSVHRKDSGTGRASDLPLLIKKQRHHFANTVPYDQSCGLSSCRVQM